MTAVEQSALQDLIKKSKPLSGTYFRSVEQTFMDPSQLLNGRGTELYGGRFAPVGMKAIYLADSDQGASAEVLTRKKRLGGASQITLDKYPRVIFAIDVKLERVVSLVRKPRNPTLSMIRTNSFQDDLGYSQEVGQFVASHAIQGLLFKRAIGTGFNLVIFLDNCTSGQISVRKLDETIETFKKIARLHKP